MSVWGANNEDKKDIELAWFGTIPVVKKIKNENNLDVQIRGKNKGENKLNTKFMAKIKFFIFCLGIHCEDLSPLQKCNFLRSKFPAILPLSSWHNKNREKK